MSVVMTGINPHRLRFTSSLESALAIEVNRPPIGDEHVLVKTSITRHEPAHQLGANASALVIGQNDQMRIINNQKAVRDGVANSDKLAAIPGRKQRMGWLPVRCAIAPASPPMTTH